VSEKLPSREQAIEFLHENHCPANVVKHCEAVAELAIEIAEACRAKGLNVDLRLVEIGALLHDVGRSKTHTVNHAIVGADLVKSAGLPESVVLIIERHVGGGITAREAEALGWPKGDYMPKTLEEKIVSYADKLIGNSKRVPIEMTIEQLRKEQKNDAAERVRRLHYEMTSQIGEDL